MNPVALQHLAQELGGSDLNLLSETIRDWKCMKYSSGQSKFSPENYVCAAKDEGERDLSTVFLKKALLVEKLFATNIEVYITGYNIVIDVQLLIINKITSGVRLYYLPSPSFGS